jgi:hypothetical protein
VVNVKIPLTLSSELQQPFRINVLNFEVFPLFNSGGSRELDFHLQCVPVGRLFQGVPAGHETNRLLKGVNVGNLFRMPEETAQSIIIARNSTSYVLKVGEMRKGV